MEELEEENQQLKKQLEELEASYNSTMIYLNATRSQLLNLPKKIVEEIMEYCKEHFNPVEGELGCIVSINREEFGEFICAILKKYGGKSE